MRACPAMKRCVPQRRVTLIFLYSFKSSRLTLLFCVLLALASLDALYMIFFQCTKHPASGNRIEGGFQHFRHCFPDC